VKVRKLAKTECFPSNDLKCRVAIFLGYALYKSIKLFPTMGNYWVSKDLEFLKIQTFLDKKCQKKVINE
jgi:hypothetical protein